MTTLEKWNRAVASGDPVRVAELAREVTTQPTQPEWIFTVSDFMWRPSGELGSDLIEGSGTDPRNQAGAGTLKLKGSSVHVGKFMACRESFVGVKVETAGLKWGYYAKKHTYSYKDSEWTSVVDLKSIWDILNYYLIFPTWQLPIQFQPISHAVYYGPIVTVIETMITEAALRIQTGAWEPVNNALSGNWDLRAWVGTLRESDGNIQTLLKRPVYVVRTNPLLDSSPTVARLVRMETVGQVITDLTGPYGIDVSVDLWEPGDPQPDPWANLDKTTYVVRVRDRSQIQGPTKTVLDSGIRDVVDLTGSLFGDAVAPLIQQANGLQSTFVSPALGVNYVEPWVLLEAPDSGCDGSVLTVEIVDHPPEGWRHIIGGKSPAWLNSLINSTLSWFIDSLTIFIGIVGIPSDLLSGFLNDAFYAFQQIDHYDRRNKMGPYHPAAERFYPTQSSGYNVGAFMNFIKALWETRGYTSAQLTFRNGEVLTLGRDLFKSCLLSLVYLGRTKMLTDHVDLIMWRYAEDARDVFIQVGDGKAEEPPLARHERKFAAMSQAINVLTLAPRSG